MFKKIIANYCLPTTTLLPTDIPKYINITLEGHKGRNHIHLTVRLGFVTQHLWFKEILGNVTEVFVHELFGHVTRVFSYVSLQLIS